MPLFEFFRVPKGKLDSIQLEKSGSGIDDLSSRTEDGLIELGWEDGQLLMQNHGSSSGSSRASKAQSLNLNNVDHDQDNLKVTKIENPDNFKEFPPSVELGTSRNDYAVPWLSNFLTQNDYNTYFTSESLDVNLGPQEKGSSFEANHDPLLSCNFTASSTTSPSYQLFPPMSFQSVSSFPSLGSQAIDSITTSELPGPSSSNKNDNMGLENFACFSKPFALMRSSIDKADGSVFSGVNGSRDKADLHVQNIMFGLSKSKVKPTEITVGSSVNSGPLDKSFPAKAVDGEKKSDCCSVSSGNNVEGCSDEPRNNLKRKSHEAESSENPSEDVEDESESVKKQAPNRVTKGKRIRSAEVHNLSERKRRDRINEKMRVLQDLIPNCNKVDKASMLDEAIEYLKSLQFQLQIMTTGAGMYMSPMVRPTAMQPLMSGPSITVPNLPFYGLPGQGFPLAMSRPPFVPLAAYHDAEANVRRSRQITDSSRLMKQSKNQSADAQDINGSRGHDQNESLRH